MKHTMLDPKTLKVDDVVIFGDSVELTVSESLTDNRADLNVYFHDGADETIVNRNSPLWKLAKIKRPKTPNKITFLGVTFVQCPKGQQYGFDPVGALKGARKIVQSLEASGVEV